MGGRSGDGGGVRFVGLVVKGVLVTDEMSSKYPESCDNGLVRSVAIVLASYVGVIPVVGVLLLGTNLPRESRFCLTTVNCASVPKLILC